MHGTHVNTEIAEKQIEGGGTSFSKSAADLEMAGAHLKEVLASAHLAACNGNDGAALTMIECAERYVGDIDEITKAIYAQVFREKNAKPIPAPADLHRPTVNPIRHALAAVDAASLGMCCVEQLATFFDAIHELASTEALTEKGMAKRLDSIRGIAKLAVRSADDLHNTIDCEREGLEEVLKALKEGGHV